MSGGYGGRMQGARGAPPPRSGGGGFGTGGGPGGPRGGGGGGQGRAREIEQALRPPAQPLAYFAPNSLAVRKELLDGDAERIAKDLATVPASQLRRFYAEVMALKRRVELAANVVDEDVQAQMALLKAKAAYTCKRQGKYPIELVAFFTCHAAAVKGKIDFLRGFQPHFEAVMAYHRVFEEKKGGGEE